MDFNAPHETFSSLSLPSPLPHESHLLFASTVGNFLFISNEAMAPSRWFYFPSRFYDTTKCDGTFFLLFQASSHLVIIVLASEKWQERNSVNHPPNFRARAGKFWCFSVGYNPLERLRKIHKNKFPPRIIKRRKLSGLELENDFWKMAPNVVFGLRCDVMACAVLANIAKYGNVL